MRISVVYKIYKKIKHIKYRGYIVLYHTIGCYLALPTGTIRAGQNSPYFANYMQRANMERANVISKLIGRASTDEKTREQAFPGGSDCKHAKLIVYTDMFGLLMLLLHGSKRFGVVYIAFCWRKSYEERYLQFDLIKVVRNRIFK
jgi:hypothetical protein